MKKVGLSFLMGALILFVEIYGFIFISAGCILSKNIYIFCGLVCVILAFTIKIIDQKIEITFYNIRKKTENIELEIRQRDELRDYRRDYIEVPPRSDNYIGRMDRELVRRELAKIGLSETMPATRNLQNNPANPDCEIKVVPIKPSEEIKSKSPLSLISGIEL